MTESKAGRNQKSGSERRTEHTRPTKMPVVTGKDGREVSLADLPLIAFALRCGHLGREYGINKHDLVFCGTCGRSQRVVRILAG